MNVLIVKTSSMGDVVHALPALSDAARLLSDAHFSWVVEESLQEIPRLHPGVSEVIPVAIRRWRKSWFSAGKEIMDFKNRLASDKFEVVIDSQGLLKSAVITRFAAGVRHGFDRRSAREPLASALYNRTHFVAPDLHAVQRQKSLFAQSLGYQFDSGIDYGIGSRIGAGAGPVMFLHGTSWASKEWPEVLWRSLAERVTAAGHELLIPAGGDREWQRAKRIAEGLPASVLKMQELHELIEMLKHCAGAVSVDTGLGHLAVALQVPVVGIYGSTDPGLTGLSGPGVELIVSNHLPCIPCRKRDCEFRKPDDSSSIYPPCYENTTPETVWLALQSQINSTPSERT